MADETPDIPAAEIEDLLRQVQDDGGAPTADPASAPAPSADAAPPIPEPQISQEELDGILGGVSESAAESAAPVSTAAPAAPPPQPAPVPMDSSSPPGDDIQLLLQQTQQAIHSIDAPNESMVGGMSAFQLQEFTGTPPSAEKATLDLIRDVELDVKIELGRTQMELEKVLSLNRGAVVPLDKLAGDFVDIFVNGRLIARGEVLVLNENFCVRVAELMEGDKVT